MIRRPPHGLAEPAQPTGTESAHGPGLAREGQTVLPQHADGAGAVVACKVFLVVGGTIRRQERSNRYEFGSSLRHNAHLR